MESKEIEKDKIVNFVDPRGSLGLLALGAVGLKAWREKRKEEEANTEKIKDNNKS